MSGSGAFSSKNAGSNIAYNINSMSLIGFLDAGDYYLSSKARSADQSPVTPRPITVSGIIGNNKVYDATNCGNIDDLRYCTSTISWQATPLRSTARATVRCSADRNVGTAKSLAVDGLTLTGTDASLTTRSPSRPVSSRASRPGLGHYPPPYRIPRSTTVRRTPRSLQPSLVS